LLDAKGYNYQVLAFGQGGDTAEGGLKRLWLPLQVRDIEIFILALGANDVVKRKPPAEIKKALTEIVQRVKAKRSKVLLCGIDPPAEYGDVYAEEVMEMYASLAIENDVALMPSLMKDVAGDRQMLLPDGIHPNENGTLKIAENVFAAMRVLIGNDVEIRNK
jgi:acyl-CoA thioesterase-1